MPTTFHVRLSRSLAVRRSGAVLAAVLAATLLTAARAGATPPTSAETSFHLTVPNFIACDGFGLTLDSDTTRRVTTFTDENGTPARVVTHIRFQGTLTNPETGRSVLDNGSFQRTVDLSDGSITVTGGFRIVTAPGEGVLLHQSGRGILFDGEVVFGAGPNDFNDGEFDALCDYLAS